MVNASKSMALIVGMLCTSTKDPPASHFAPLVNLGIEVVVVCAIHESQQMSCRPSGIFVEHFRSGSWQQPSAALHSQKKRTMHELGLCRCFGTQRTSFHPICRVGVHAFIRHGQVQYCTPSMRKGSHCQAWFVRMPCNSKNELPSHL